MSFYSFFFVSLFIGDPDQKLFISGEPELDVIDLDGTEDFLILACDGLWDGLSAEDVTGVLYRYLANCSPNEPVEAVAAKLVHQSKLQGSEDNITAIVIFLRDIKDIKESAEKFLSNPLYCVQSHDFMSMNGNSEVPFSKPTVLELNATSSKKLKNAANVMSSAGFGGASYSYQYLDNSESSFHTVDTMGIDNAQNIYASQTISASCFAPEATALSELPTPPIDDMLASQQFDNFSSTDLYKELNTSAQSSQNVQLFDIVNSNTESNPKLDKLFELPSGDALPHFVNDSVDNGSLLDIESNTTTNLDKISPDEAVGIASTVVSTTIEKAVKCISSELSDSIPIQSQLNPYAKPFVMKSFFSSEESSSSSISFTSSEMSAMDPTSPSVSCEKENNKFDNQLVNVTVQETLKESKVSQNAESIVAEIVHPADEELSQSITGSAISDNLVLGEDLAVVENKISERSLNTEQIIQNVDLLSSNRSKDNISNVPEGSIFDSETIEQISYKENISNVPDVSNPDIVQESSKLNNDENVQQKEIHVLPTSDEGKKSDFNIFSQEKVAALTEPFEEISPEFTTQSLINVREPESMSNQNVDVLLDLQSEKINLITSDFESKIEALEAVSVYQMNIQESEIQAGEILDSSVTACKEAENLEHNQNSDIYNISKALSENTLLEAERKSKCEEIQKSIVDAVEKNAATEISSLIEPLSLIDIKDELIPTEAEVPSDPSVEDSRVESVAVDLKLLPEGIPEAEGVTEDIDSDSEKDGGWSYMKGNIVGGSKSKPNEKTHKTSKTNETTPKTSKANETKSNLTPKGKRDVLKPAIDVKSRMKNDKTKSPLVDKSKDVSEKAQTVVSVDKSKSTVTVDRTKATSADKAKSLSSADKTKTLVSADKNKRVPIEKKPLDIRAKITKSSSVTTAKVTADKTTKATTVSTVKRETSDTAKTATSTLKQTRPTTLQRSTAPISKPSSAAVASKTVAKPRVTATTVENKTLVRNVATASKVQTTTQTKTTSLSTRTVPVRPATTSASKTSTMMKPLAQKSVGVVKLKQPSTATIPRKPITTVAKKPEIKEVKDTVNKQILAKKTTTTTKGESSSTLTSRKVMSANNKSAVSKLSTISKSEVSKKNVPKSSAVKSTKSEASKASQEMNKSKNEDIESVQSKTEVAMNSLNIETDHKNVDSVQCKTDEAKNSLNIESSQKNAEEIMQVAEEKFILEVADQEKMEKEVTVTSKEQTVKVENSSSSNPVSPVAVERSVTESTPENL